MLSCTVRNLLSSEYKPSPLAALGSVCGPLPSGTAHPLHREKQGDREETHEQCSTTWAENRENGEPQEKQNKKKLWNKKEIKRGMQQRRNRETPSCNAHAVAIQDAQTYRTSDLQLGRWRMLWKFVFWPKIAENRGREATSSDGEKWKENEVKNKIWGKQKAQIKSSCSRVKILMSCGDQT